MVVHLFRWWHTWNNSPNTSLTPAWLVGWVGDKGHQAGRSSGRAPAHTQRLTPTHTHTHTKKKQLNKRPQNIVDHNTHTENQAEFEHFFTGKGQLPAALKDFPVVWPVLSDFLKKCPLSNLFNGSSTYGVNTELYWAMDSECPYTWRQNGHIFILVWFVLGQVYIGMFWTALSRAPSAATRSLLFFSAQACGWSPIVSDWLQTFLHWRRVVSSKLFFFWIASLGNVHFLCRLVSVLHIEFYPYSDRHHL